MEDEVKDDLTIEIIPDQDIVFRRVHRNHVDGDNMVMPVAFPTEEDGLSVNWSKYSTPENTKNESVSFGKDPSNYGVISLPVITVREIPLRVIHSPRPHNLAHSSILDIPPRKPNDLGIRLKLRAASTWEILID